MIIIIIMSQKSTPPFGGATILHFNYLPLVANYRLYLSRGLIAVSVAKNVLYSPNLIQMINSY